MTSHIQKAPRGRNRSSNKPSDEHTLLHVRHVSFTGKYCSAHGITVLLTLPIISGWKSGCAQYCPIFFSTRSLMLSLSKFISCLMKFWSPEGEGISITTIKHSISLSMQIYMYVYVIKCTSQNGWKKWDYTVTLLFNTATINKQAWAYHYIEYEVEKLMYNKVVFYFTVTVV